jgi:DNA-binding NarL/FixJ family response regulator
MGVVPSEKIRVLVVEDHPVVRVGITAILNGPSMEVVAEAENGQQALKLFEEYLPDITLVDLRLPDISGVEVIRQLHERHPEARFVVLTTYEGDEDISQALEAGARGYIIKGMPYEALIHALKQVHAGHRYLPRPVSDILESRPAATVLSPRERAVLQLVVAGKSNKEIAAELDITEATVKGHLTLIFCRLGVTDRTQAVVAALRRGLVHL